MPKPVSRRTVLKKAAGLGLLTAFPVGSAAFGADSAGDVLPVEDLMREHGVLARHLLIYEDILRRIRENQPVRADVLARSAGMIRRFVEDYHEKNEENFIFPRFERSGTQTDLVRTLRAQHDAGRQLTAVILEYARGSVQAASADRAAEAMTAFIRMYRPHKAREDTVLFPAFRNLVSAEEYSDIGERFESRERELFGEKGFETVVQETADMERALGIDDLATFTPKL